MSDNKKQIRTEIRKRKRKGGGRKGRLVPYEQYKEPGFVYRVCSNADGRIQFMEGNDWEVVKDNEGKGQGNGSKVSCQAGSGLEQILMKIPEEWYNADQLEKSQENRELDAAMGKASSSGLTNTGDFESKVTHAEPT